MVIKVINDYWCHLWSISWKLCHINNSSTFYILIWFMDFDKSVNCSLNCPMILNDLLNYSFLVSHVNFFVKSLPWNIYYFIFSSRVHISKFYRNSVGKYVAVMFPIYLVVLVYHFEYISAITSNENVTCSKYNVYLQFIQR